VRTFHKAGKIPASVLVETVLRHRGVERGEVLVHSSFGEDSCAIQFGEWACVLSTDPITGAGDEAGWFAVHVAVNDVAAMGAEPIGVLLTVFLPTGTDLPLLETTMDDAERAAKGLGIEIIGGHTEVVSGLPRLMLSATAVGRARADSIVTSSGARPGDDLVLTKGAGIEGTAILAADLQEDLRGLGPETLERAKAFVENISVVPEAAVAARLGASAMHDVVEGGVIGATCEMAEASSAGAVLDAHSIPVAIETRRICEVLGVDPLRLISSGSLLVAIEDGQRLVRELSGAGVRAAVIGRVVEGAGTTLRVGGEERQVSPPERDELWRALERKKKRPGCGIIMTEDGADGGT